MFRKADIRKQFREKYIENSLKIRNHFLEAYKQFLNNFLSSTLLKIKERFLILKNRLITELTTDLYQLMQVKINENYENYVEFLLNTIKKISPNIDKPLKIIFYFNSKDYKYFIKNSDKIRNIIQNTFEISKINNDIIGGFKVSLSEGNLYYNYTISNLISKNLTLIQMEFSKIVSDSEIKKIEFGFNEFIQNQKLVINKYLKDYDRI